DGGLRCARRGARTRDDEGGTEKGRQANARQDGPALGWRMSHVGNPASISGSRAVRTRMISVAETVRSRRGGSSHRPLVLCLLRQLERVELRAETGFPHNVGGVPGQDADSLFPVDRED